MAHKTPELSQEIYHRIYRLAKRNVSPAAIATMLHLPVDAVQGIISRLLAQPHGPASHSGDHPAKAASARESSYLDIYTFSKSRYAIIDISGMLTSAHLDILREEIGKVSLSAWKAVAMRMGDVLELDEAAADQIVAFREDFIGRGRYVAILDPSRHIEPVLERLNLGEKIPIFGTERAFEEKAFSFEPTRKTKKSSAGKA